MEWFLAVVVVAILGVAAMAAAGGGGGMATDPVRDTFRQDLPEDRPLIAADLQQLRFGVTLRGYVMSQVDEVLDRLTREVAERDAVIAALRRGADPDALEPTGDPVAAGPAPLSPESRP